MSMAHSLWAGCGNIVNKWDCWSRPLQPDSSVWITFQNDNPEAHPLQYPSNSVSKATVTRQPWTYLDIRSCMWEHKCPNQLDQTFNRFVPASSLVQSLCNVRLSPCVNRAGHCPENSQPLDPVLYDTVLKKKKNNSQRVLMTVLSCDWRENLKNTNNYLLILRIGPNTFSTDAWSSSSWACPARST